ncbi:hypothetical protein [Streptomyces collinus]|uniref:hypothetical protein n=1 Tax=Streptomyces collinus TaxID=42684 RepID=UPI00341B1C63
MLPSPTHLFEHLLRFLWPPSGRHRHSAARPVTSPAHSRPDGPPRHHTSMLRGEDNALVRPYLIARDLHGMQVTA